MAKQDKGVMPRLRFPEFRESSWDRIPGDRIFDSVSNRSAEAGLPILAITQEHGAIPRDLIDYHVSVTDKSIESYKVVERGDFIISLRSFQGGIEYSNYRGICSPAYVILRRTGEGSSHYFKHLFKSGRFIQQLTRNIEGLRDGKMISYKQFSEQLIATPAPAEQQKIADCLTSLDEVIAAQGRKVEALKAYKRCLMQQLFPREGETRPRLRFPEFRDAPEWRGESLARLGHFLSPLSGKTASDFDCGDAKFIPYSNVYDNTFIDPAALRAVSVSAGERQNSVRRGDVFFTVSSETTADAGMSSVLLENIADCYLNSFCALFRFSEMTDVDSVFAGYFLRSPPVRAYLASNAQGAIRYNISRSVFQELQLLLPTFGEQRRIADCLNSIDTQIAAESSQLAALKTHKRGLMQQLFPAPVDV